MPVCQAVQACRPCCSARIHMHVEVGDHGGLNGNSPHRYYICIRSSQLMKCLKRLGAVALLEECVNGSGH